MTNAKRHSLTIPAEVGGGHLASRKYALMAPRHWQAETLN